MAQVQLIIDLVTPGVGRRRAERTTSLPGVPGVGEFVVVARMLTLKVAAVTWDARKGTAMVFLGRADGNSDSIVDHDGELELPDHHVDGLTEADWDIDEYH